MPDRKISRVFVFVLISLVALSSALKELSQAHALFSDAAEFVSQWSEGVVPTANARTTVKRIRVETLVASAAAQTGQPGDFHWSGVIAPGQSIEIKGLNGDIKAEPATGNEAEVSAVKTSRRSDVNSVQIKVLQHAGGVTICAQYPTDAGSSSGCDESKNHSVNNNDVRVDFTVRVPARVTFQGRTINGDISAIGLTGNVDTKTINGSIKISTTGYAEASTINGEISAKLGDANWPTAIDFKTLNGEINLDLPPTASTDVDAETLNGQINSDFPINLISFKDRKHLRGRIGTGGRELNLKTLNGSINLRLGNQ